MKSFEYFSKLYYSEKIDTKLVKKFIDNVKGRENFSIEDSHSKPIAHILK